MYNHHNNQTNKSSGHMSNTI